MSDASFGQSDSSAPGPTLTTCALQQVVSYPGYSGRDGNAVHGDDLTRENVMKQAANLKGLAPRMLLPGITINTGPNDYVPIKQMQMQRFNGQSWELFGPIMTGEVGG